MRSLRVVSLALFGLVSACATVIVPRPIESGVEGDPLCTDRVGSGGFDCPPPSPGVEPSITTGGGVHNESRNLREAAIGDLYDLRGRQSAYHRLHLEYSRWIDELDFASSPGVTVRILRATEGGWSAISRVASLQLECAIFDGDVSPPRAYATRRAVAECQR